MSRGSLSVFRMEGRTRFLPQPQVFLSGFLASFLLLTTMAITCHSRPVKNDLETLDRYSIDLAEANIEISYYPRPIIRGTSIDFRTIIRGGSVEVNTFDSRLFPTP